MPDITMCYGIKCRSVCPMKDQCHRHVAEPNPYRQSYFVTAPFEIKEDMTVVCEYFSLCQRKRIDGKD